jgi:hypothetical protein
LARRIISGKNDEERREALRKPICRAENEFVLQIFIPKLLAGCRKTSFVIASPAFRGEAISNLLFSHSQIASLTLAMTVQVFFITLLGFQFNFVVDEKQMLF